MRSVTLTLEFDADDPADEQAVDDAMESLSDWMDEVAGDTGSYSLPAAVICMMAEAIGEAFKERPN